MRTATRPVIPIAPQPAAGEAVWLYEKRRQIYPRAVSGRGRSSATGDSSGRQGVPVISG